jgi:hypothetical protein
METLNHNHIKEPSPEVIVLLPADASSPPLKTGLVLFVAFLQCLTLLGSLHILTPITARSTYLIEAIELTPYRKMRICPSQVVIHCGLMLHPLVPPSTRVAVKQELHRQNLHLSFCNHRWGLPLESFVIEIWKKKKEEKKDKKKEEMNIRNLPVLFYANSMGLLS